MKKEYWITPPENKMNDVIQKYCEERGWYEAGKIDARMSVIIKRPYWCPKWLHKIIIKNFVEVVEIKYPPPLSNRGEVK